MRRFGQAAGFTDFASGDLAEALPQGRQPRRPTAAACRNQRPVTRAASTSNPTGSNGAGVSATRSCLTVGVRPR